MEIEHGAREEAVVFGGGGGDLGGGLVELGLAEFGDGAGPGLVAGLGQGEGIAGGFEEADGQVQALVGVAGVLVGDADVADDGCFLHPPALRVRELGRIALGGIKNKVQAGDLGFDGRSFPVGSEPKGFGSDELGLQERWYPIQVKQKDQAGRPDIDQFETAMRRARCAKGCFVSFAFSDDALREIQRFFVEEHAVIVPLTVQEILEEQIGMKRV